MVKVIMGLKGSGKTKQLVKDINEAVQSRDRQRSLCGIWQETDL